MTTIHRTTARGAILVLGLCLQSLPAQAAPPPTGLSISPGLGTLAQLLHWLLGLFAT